MKVESGFFEYFIEEENMDRLDGMERGDNWSKRCSYFQPRANMCA